MSERDVTLLVIWGIALPPGNALSLSTSGGRRRFSRSGGPGGAELASGTVTRQMKGEVRDIFSASGLLGSTGSGRPPPESLQRGVQR